MSMNRYMHPRNIYKKPPNFAQLAEKYPEFRRLASLDITGNLIIDFKNENVLRTLTRCLLLHDFNLDVYLPANKLVPTLPLRLNYILWLEDIMSEIGVKSPTGIDVGCGSSCIYPLLAAKQNGWHMIALETNPESVHSAERNVAANNLTDFIRVISQDSESAIFGKLDDDFRRHQFDFTMCNPPFFDSHNDQDFANNNRTGNRPDPKNAKTGSYDELTVSGGEYEFVKKIIDESAQLRQTVKIFTTMLGHKSSLLRLLRHLATCNITNVTQTEFGQGNTTRWGVAWSFQAKLFLRKVPAYGASIVANKLFRYTVADDECLANTYHRLEVLFKQIDLTLEMKVMTADGCQCTAKVLAIKNTWSNQRRKRRKMKRECGAAPVELDNRINEIRDADDSTIDSYFAEEPKEKRGKLEFGGNSQHDMFLVFGVALRKVGKHKIELELEYLSGTAKIDGVYQVYQYVLNNWKKFNL